MRRKREMAYFLALLMIMNFNIKTWPTGMRKIVAERAL